MIKKRKHTNSQQQIEKVEIRYKIELIEIFLPELKPQ
jgi:hypothetical protein